MHHIIFPPQKLSLQAVELPWLHQNKVQLAVLRADLIDPLLSGNKFFKLKYNLKMATEQGKSTLLSFGGAWSNHLHALAAAGQRFGFTTIGVVRGQQTFPLNACLQDAVQMGMKLHFVSRADYQQKNNAYFINSLKQEFGDFYLIPEGGANLAGILGCQEIIEPTLAQHYTHLVLAAGTGTTMAGLVTSTHLPVLGIQILRGKNYLHDEIQRMLHEHSLHATSTWSVNDVFHAGGYAKVNAQFLAFMDKFSASTDIPLEYVYSGKMFWAISELIKNDFFPLHARILAIHGGGLQGQRGHQ